MRSVYLQKDKDIFKVADLPAEKFAASLGLPGAPKIKFLKNAKDKKNVPRVVAAPPSDEDDGDGSELESSSGSEDEKQDEDGKTFKEPKVRVERYFIASEQF